MGAEQALGRTLPGVLMHRCCAAPSDDAQSYCGLFSSAFARVAQCLAKKPREDLPSLHDCI
jgi:hypothetical protein